MEQMVQPQNFFFLIIFMVVPRGTAAPVLFQWSLGRDVSTGAPSYNGTIISIFTSLSLFSVYLHSRGFIRSMDGAKRIVLIEAKPLLLPGIIDKSSSRTGARNAFLFTPFFLHFLIPRFMGDLSDLESFCSVLCFLLLGTLLLSSNHRRDRLADKGRERAQERKRQMLWPNDEKQRRNGGPEAAEGYLGMAGKLTLTPSPTRGHTTGRSREIVNPFLKHNQGWVGNSSNRSWGSGINCQSPPQGLRKWGWQFPELPKRAGETAKRFPPSGPLRLRGEANCATQFPKGRRQHITLTPSPVRGGGKGSRGSEINSPQKGVIYRTSFSRSGLQRAPIGYARLENAKRWM